MARATVRVVLNRGELLRMRYPGGAVYDAVEKYTRRVTLLAKAKANVDTGRMRAQIRSEMSGGKIVTGTIISPAEYTPYVHEGRGPVYPKRAKALRFKPKGSSAFVFAKKVKGYKGNPFLTDALKKGQPWPVIGG